MTWTYPYYACAAGLDPVAGDMRTDYESMIMIDYCASLNSSLTEEIGIKLSSESESHSIRLSFNMVADERTILDLNLRSLNNPLAYEAKGAYAVPLLRRGGGCRQ